MTSNSENSDLLKNKEYGSGSEEAEFNVVLHDVRATDLASRNRFRDKLKLVIELDGAKDKSKKQVISGAGEVKWKGPYKFDYKIWSYKHLGDKNILIKLLKSKTEEVGRVSVDLWTVATGPKEHNLPIVDLEGKSIGRLQFILDFEEVSNVAVLFKEIKLKNLKPPSSTTECHPYLKYAYSKNWPVLDDGKKYAVYSTVQYNNKNPEWYDLPEVRFKAPLREILSESIVLHVTHSGSVLNTTLGRCNLLFRTLVDNGKTFKETDLISFKGPLKIDNAEIQGVLVFRFLPRTAQMKSASAIKKALHTESGIHDALPLLPHLPLPNKPLIRSTEAAVDLSQAGGDSPSIQKKRAAAFGPKAVFKDARGGPRSPAQVLHSPELGKAMPKAKELEDKGVKDKPAKFVDDLISLDTPPLQRANARTAFPAALLGSGQEEDPFQASAIPAGSFKPPPALMGSASDPGRPAAPSASNPAAAVNPFLSANTNPAAATFNPFEGQAAPAPVVAAAQPPAQQATLPVGYVDYYGNFPNYQHGNAFTTHAAAPSYGAQPGNFGPTGSFGAQPGNYNTAGVQPGNYNTAGVQPGNYNTAGVQPGNFNTTGSFGAGYPAAGVLSPEQIHRQQQLLQQQQAMLQQQMQALNIHQQAIQKQNQPAQNPFGNPF